MMFMSKTPRVLAFTALLPIAVAVSGCVRDEPVAGHRLAVSNFTEEPARNSVFFSSDNAENLVVPPPQSSGDPTMHGAFVGIYNPMTHEDDVYILPADNWTTLPAPEEGYSYLDVKHEHGPCEYAAVVAGKRLVASCRGPEVHFTLDEPRQEALDFELLLGAAGGTRYCASFGGFVMRDVSTADAPVGRFLAAHAPAPITCGAS